MKFTSFAAKAMFGGALILGLAACLPEEEDEASGAVSSASAEPSQAPIYSGMLMSWPTEADTVDLAVSTADDVYSQNYVISIDVSGSMDGRCSGERKIKTAQTAAIEFLGNIPAEAAVGLSTFGDRVGMLVPLAHNNHDAVETAIAGLRADGGTPMASALEASYNSLATAGAGQFGYGEYNLVVLGDGEPSSGDPSPRSTTEWLDYMATQTPIQVTTIGFCADLSVLDRPWVNFQTADDLDQLRAAFQSVLAEAETFVDGEF